MSSTSHPVVLGAHDGEVVSFDDPRGLGVVGAVDGTGLELGFHCTAIADGTRTIPVGTGVSFRVVAGRLGRWEAADIRRRPGAA